MLATNLRVSIYSEVNMRIDNKMCRSDLLLVDDQHALVDHTLHSGVRMHAAQ